jgi:hypothetical protein
MITQFGMFMKIASPGYYFALQGISFLTDLHF